MKGLLEYKDVTAEIKDVDMKSRTVTGWWSSYGNKDFDRDIIEAGAARKTIAERGPLGSNEIFFLNQHNWSQPHTKPSILEDTPKGIYFEATMPMVNGEMTSYSKDSLILYEADSTLDRLSDHQGGRKRIVFRRFICALHQGNQVI